MRKVLRSVGVHLVDLVITDRDFHVWSMHELESQIGRVDRPPRPRIWIYRHHRAPGELAVDDEGRTYKFNLTRDRRSLGLFKELDNRSAIFRADLVDVIEPISYRDELHEAIWARLDEIEG